MRIVSGWRTGAIVALALCIATGSALAQKPPAKDKKPPPAKEVAKPDPQVEFTKKFDALEKKLSDANDEFDKKMKAAKDNEERKKLYESVPGAEFVDQYKALAEEAKGTDVGAKAWCKAGMLGASYDKSEVAETAIETLLNEYVTSPSVKELPMLISRVYAGDAADKALKQVFEKSPHKPIKAAALYAQAEIADNKGKKGAAEARALYERLGKEFGDEKPMYGDDNYKTMVESWIFVQDNLQIGKSVPDFEATDESGVKFKLSDYKGKVVVIDFWGFW